MCRNPNHPFVLVFDINVPSGMRFYFMSQASFGSEHNNDEGQTQNSAKGE